MSKKPQIDAHGDSDELQALFDSIAVEAGRDETAAPAVTPTPAPAEQGDDADLQALFDEVAASYVEPAAPISASPDVVPSNVSSAASGDEEVFSRIGQMTRQVHEMLRGLGLDTESLSDAVQGIPDARQRLSYIAQTTEQAASRVLNATDTAKPLQDALANGASDLEARWNKLYDNQLSVDEFKLLAGETRSFLAEVKTSSHSTGEHLMEIMMAQDFQDLTGQVIKKVVDLAQQLESQLLQLLIETMPEERRAASSDGLKNGPAIDPTAADVVTTQEQVDDLLDSLGF
ncbi:MAG TPA: protein phosphatase CheZ [Azoarcus sp.]|nr:protein phosphatase CheZ [Azoarcus sp.]